MSEHQLLVATRKGVFQLAQSNGRWDITQASFLGDNCSMVMHDPRDGSLLAALGHGHFGCKLHRSTDNGVTWEQISDPTYPLKPDGYDEQSGDMVDEHTKLVPWRTELIWDLQPGSADQPGTLWCGTLPGGLFRSDDGGQTWSLNEPLWLMEERHQWFGGGYDFPGIHSVCVDPRNHDHVIVGVSCGGAWATEDGGLSWENRAQGMRAAYMPEDRAYDVNIQDPHLIVRCRDEPDCLWTQHHNGIFRSVDNGRNWTEIQHEPVGDMVSAFGFAVAVHPSHPDTAWFAPAIKDEKRIPVDGKLVITRTRDGGKTFERLTDNLPQEHCYDLTFRHCLALCEHGQHLAFGTTTGSLYISDDQGDHFELISSNLPPVHAVRWTTG